MKKTTTIRISEELDNELTQYAKTEELSKNQVIKKAIKMLVERKQDRG